MSEDTKDTQETIVDTSKENTPPKQYLMVVDTLTMACLNKLVPTLQFFEVQGLNVEGHDKHQFLVTPVPENKQEKSKESVSDETSKE